MSVQLPQHDLPKDQHDLPKELIAALEGHDEFAVISLKIPELISIAAEIFPGEIEIEFEADPEVPTCHYLAFNVAATGETKDIALRRREWHHRTIDILGSDSDRVRLLVAVES